MPSLALQLVRAGHYRAAFIELPKATFQLHMKHLRRLLNK